ncbi:MAG: hypothetical protein GXY50_04200 [Syntrophomonadaceae bacterium]|nr:hypothetical protein [Syntrophomonadaceae bacterium]
MTEAMEYQQLFLQLLQQEASEELVKLRQLILLRMALEGDVKSTRIPTPANITEVGGYYNLLAKLNQKTMQRQLISSALGLSSDYAPDVMEDAIKKFVKELYETK